MFEFQGKSFTVLATRLKTAEDYKISIAPKLHFIRARYALGEFTLYLVYS